MAKEWRGYRRLPKLPEHGQGGELNGLTRSATEGLDQEGGVFEPAELAEKLEQRNPVDFGSGLRGSDFTTASSACGLPMRAQSRVNKTLGAGCDAFHNRSSGSAKGGGTRDSRRPSRPRSTPARMRFVSRSDGAARSSLAHRAKSPSEPSEASTRAMRRARPPGP